MYLDYFHLTQAPFSITPDPEFVYLSEKHQESLAHLVYGVTRGGGAGFVQLTGEVGTGKTTISRLFLQKLPEGTQAALILNPIITPVELLENIYKEFKLPLKGVEGHLNAMIDRLNQRLLEWYEQGKNTVVIIDEAQNIPRDTLEQLRLLTNLETSQQKLLQIILIGQPELKATMQRRDLRQLSQRITSRFHLQPLSAAETQAYITHRLLVAGLEQPLFSAASCKKVHHLTQGTPRLINTLCDRALLAAFVDESSVIKSKHINQAADEVLGKAQNQSKLWMWLTLSALALMILMVYKFWPVEMGVKDKVIDSSRTKKSHQTPETISPKVINTPNNSQVWQAYYNLWYPGEVFLWGVNQCPNSKDSGMSCLRRQGNLNQIKRLNTPVLLEISSQKMLLLIAVDGNQWQVFSEGGIKTLAQSEIAQQWFGTYFILWPLAEELIGDTIAEKTAEWVNSVATVIENRSFTLEQSQAWVVEFQQRNGLLADGIVGSETQMALSLQVYQGPKLKKQ